MPFATRARARAATATALAVALGAALVTAAPPAAALEEGEVIRVAGIDRYATAADAAERAYPGGADEVVLASGVVFPDALAASGLSGSPDAPILLTAPGSLPSQTVAALGELDPTRVTIIGGTAAVSDAVLDEVEDLGYDVERVAGADRYATAARAATEVGGTTAVLASGRRFADALAISPGAHALELPVLLTDGDSLDAATRAYLDAADVDTVIVVGGTAAVSDELAQELTEDGIAVTRLAGADRYETAAAIARFHTTVGFSFDRILLASGERFPDALTGGPLGSALGAPLLLTPAASLGDDAAAVIGDNARAATLLARTDLDVLGAAVFTGTGLGAGEGLLLSDDGLAVIALDDPAAVTDDYTFTGRTDGTTLLGLDVRGAAGMPYAFGSDGQLYVLGAPKAATPTVIPLEKAGAPNPEVATALGADGELGIDFNPAVDRLRVLVGEVNLRLNPNNGATAATDGALAYVDGDENEDETPEVTAGAYTNDVRGGVAPATALYDLDSAADVLALQSPPNDGGLVTIGALGIDLGDVNGFDFARNGTGYVLGADAILPAQLWTVDLETGALTSAGQLPPALLLAGVTGLAVR